MLNYRPNSSPGLQARSSDQNHSHSIVAGGFVAGTHAGFAYNTFPLMEGRLIPSAYDAMTPLWRNLTENIAAVQFDHRLLAILTALAAISIIDVSRDCDVEHDFLRARFLIHRRTFRASAFETHSA